MATGHCVNSKTQKWLTTAQTFIIGCIVEPVVVGCFVLEQCSQGTVLHVFQSRLKIKTGRARFRETGKLMQGNGLRH